MCASASAALRVGPPPPVSSIPSTADSVTVLPAQRTAGARSRRRTITGQQLYLSSVYRSIRYARDTPVVRSEETGLGRKMRADSSEVNSSPATLARCQHSGTDRVSRSHTPSSHTESRPHTESVTPAEPQLAGTPSPLVGKLLTSRYAFAVIRCHSNLMPRKRSMLCHDITAARQHARSYPSCLLLRHVSISAHEERTQAAPAAVRVCHAYSANVTSTRRRA